MGRATGLLAILLLALAQDAPDVSFTAPDGKTVKVSDYRGKKSVVLLFMRGYFGDFSCFHCASQTRSYKAAYERIQGAGAEVLMVLPGAKDAKGYLEKIGTQDEKNPDPKFSVPYPVLYDRDFLACKAFNVPFEKVDDSFPVFEPATVVISKEGKTLWSHHGKQPDDRPAVELVLEALKTGKPPAVAAAKASGAKSEAGPTLAWLPYEKALEEAKAARKPLLIDFYADW